MKTLQFAERTLIDKGWSEDRKYCVTDETGEKFFLRISPPEACEEVKERLSWLEKLSRMEIPMSRPVEFGICDEGVYMVETWIDGEDLGDVISEMSSGEQYGCGIDMGRALKKIHTLPAPSAQEPWESRFNRKMDYKIEAFRSCNTSWPDGEKLIGYIQKNRHLIQGRPQSFQHGDYHIGNMMYADGKPLIIDFDRYDFGDPWEEFNRIVWSAQASARFASGMVDGYFDGEPPMEFWRLLALYISSNTLGSFQWTETSGSDLDVMLRQAEDVICWYDGMTRIVPRWYGRV